MIVPTADQFADWLENPVTEFVRAGLKAYAQGQAADYGKKAWGGDLSPETRERYKAREDAYSGLSEITYSQALGMMGVEESEDG